MNSAKLSDRWKDEACIVLKWYPALLTKSETQAFNNLIVEGKAADARSSSASKLLRSAKSQAKEAVEELKEGPEVFMKKTLLRVMTEHGSELVRCPRCSLVIPRIAIVCDHCCLFRRNNCTTRRSSEREPADSLRDKSNVIGGWLPSLTSPLRGSGK
jgi:uncharacterized C2H2 Zn-finger protein